MKYFRNISISVILLLSLSASSQENLKLCPYNIKELLLEFDKYTCLGNDFYQKDISPLFYYDESFFGEQKIMANIFINWFGDDGPDMLTMSEYASQIQ